MCKICTYHSGAIAGKQQLRVIEGELTDEMVVAKFANTTRHRVIAESKTEEKEAIVKVMNNVHFLHVNGVKNPVPYYSLDVISR